MPPSSTKGTRNVNDQTTTTTTTTTTTPPPQPPDSQIQATTSLSYWNSISPDVSGMLGGYPQISRIDLQGSKNFLSKLSRLDSRSRTGSTSTTKMSSSITVATTNKKIKLAVDCGAGIGRITTGLLTQVSEVVDVVEPIEKFARVLKDSELKRQGKVGDVYVMGLEKWLDDTRVEVGSSSSSAAVDGGVVDVVGATDTKNEKTKKYDLIWNQWCLGHLTDRQLTDYLGRAKGALNEGGWIVVKENLSMQPYGEDVFDELDSSVTRSDGTFKRIFEDAGLNIVKAELQTGFPKGLGLYPVKMYGLRPK